MQDQRKRHIDQTSIMQLLDKRKMEVIKKSFTTDGLDIHQFIKVMHQHLDFNRDDPEQLERTTVALVDLFKQIDVNGDATMQWQQFNNHVIELGMLRNDRSFKNVIKNYYPSENISDKEKHQNGIEQIYFFQKIKKLLILQKDSSSYKLYHAGNCQLAGEVVAHKCHVLCAEYIPCQDMIATSSNDLTIIFWETSNLSMKQIVSVPQIQLCMKYADWGKNKRLIYTGGTDAIIHIFQADTLKQKDTMSGWNPFYKRDQQQHGHSGPIGDILPIESQQTLVTASYDTNICLWDATTHSPKKTLTGHNKGVYSLDWSDFSPMNQCLVSAGLDHQAFIWNTYVSTNIFLLRGHNHPLVGVKCLPQSPQIVTADTSGMVKVWDVRNFLCMQTFNQKDQINSFTMTYSTSKYGENELKKRIVCAGRKLHFFQYDQPKDQYLTDQKICLKVLYNQTLLVFITLHPDCIKVWEAVTGKLTSVYRALSHSQLTCAILDNRKRKLFIGTFSGQIFTVNIRNGAKMRQFINHTGMITGLCHWTGSGVKGLDQRSQNQRRLISISKGRHIKFKESREKGEGNDPVFVHDQDSPEGAPNSLRYKMNKHQQGVNSVVTKENTEYMASCSDDGSIVIMNLLTFRQFVLSRKSNTSVSKLIFLDPYDCLIAADSDGVLHFYGVYQSKFRNQQILQADYTTSSFTKKQQKFPVSAMAFERDSKTLLLGDQFGNIQFWDISILCDKVSMYKIDDPKKKRSSQTPDPARQEQGFITSISGSGYDSIERVQNIFFKNDIQRIHCIKKAHNDGITHIEIVRSKLAKTMLATSSFDCCVHIWSFDGKRLGSLILGHDRNWNLKFKTEQRQQQAFQQARQLLTDISTVKSQTKKEQQVESDDQGKTVQERKKLKYNRKCQNVFRRGRQALQKFKEQSDKKEEWNINEQMISKSLLDIQHQEQQMYDQMYKQVMDYKRQPEMNARWGKNKAAVQNKLK